MESVLSTMLGNYEKGKVTRREFIEAVSVLAGTAAMAPAALAAAPVAPIVPVSVNHIAISVSDMKRSKDWYTRILKLKVIQENDTFALLQFGNTQLVLRTTTAQRPTLVATRSSQTFRTPLFSPIAASSLQDLRCLPSLIPDRTTAFKPGSGAKTMSRKLEFRE